MCPSIGINFDSVNHPTDFRFGSKIEIKMLSYGISFDKSEKKNQCGGENKKEILSGNYKI